MIAELRGTGSGVGDMVTWKSSDPASGTVVSYTNDGAANTGFVSEQTEPLGQSVALTDPEPPNEPQTYEQHLFFASDPEWQCSVPDAFYGGFQGRPDHCQNKVLRNLDIPLTDTFKWNTIPCESSSDPETISVCTETTRDPADKRFEASYAGDYEFKSNGVTYSVGQKCIDALAVAGKNINSLRQAFDNLERITAITNKKKVSAHSLMAIGIRESGAGDPRYMKEEGGHGRGWYQIDLGIHSNVTEAQAMDFDWATRYVSDLVSNAYAMISNYESNDQKRHKNPLLLYTFSQRLAMMYRIYNAGPVSPAMRDMLRKTDDLTVLDPGTARNNYASNLYNLEVYCTGGATVIK